MRNCMKENKDNIDQCPRCGDDKLRGFEDYAWVVCWTCEWTIDKKAWLIAWKCSND